MADDSGQQERWSPFPVQDWSTMPPDTGRAAPPPEPRWGPDARWGPPSDSDRVGRGAPPRWLPAVVIIACLALVAAGLHGADRIGITAAEVVEEFVPADGAVGYFATTTSRADIEPEQRTTVVESARRVGPEGLLSLDFTLGTHVIASVGEERVQKVPFWRTTSTPIGADTGGQTTLVYDLTRAVELIAESGPEVTRTYFPAIVALPATVADLDLDQPGATAIHWDGSGTVGRVQGYSYAFTGRVESPGCVRVTGQIDYAGSSEAEASTRTLAQLWCTGRGLVAADDTEAGVERRTTEVAAPRTEVDTTPTATDWGDPSAWQAREVTARSVEPHLGEGDATGSPSGLPPQLTSSGVLVRVSDGQDLVGLVTRDPDTVVVRWRAHPGGSVISTYAFGDLLIATTSLRTVVAYDTHGTRLWSAALPDVVFSAPAVAGDLVLVTTLSGEVHALDRHTGAIRWRVALRSEVAPRSWVSADTERTLVMARSGVLVALETRTGAELWRTEVTDGVLTRLVDDQVVVAADLSLWGLSATDGAIRWRTRTAGRPTDLQVDAGRIVLRAERELVSLGLDGGQQWMHTVDAPVVVAGDQLVTIREDQLLAIDRTGETVAETEVPPATTGSNRRLLAAPDGVWFFDLAWTHRRWSR